MVESIVVIRNGESHVDIVHDHRQVMTINVSNILTSILDSFRKPRDPKKELTP